MQYHLGPRAGMLDALLGGVLEAAAAAAAATLAGCTAGRLAACPRTALAMAAEGDAFLLSAQHPLTFYVPPTQGSAAAAAAAVVTPSPAPAYAVVAGGGAGGAADSAIGGLAGPWSSSAAAAGSWNPSSFLSALKSPGLNLNLTHAPHFFPVTCRDASPFCTPLRAALLCILSRHVMTHCDAL